jgi:recombination protein RecA
MVDRVRLDDDEVAEGSVGSYFVGGNSQLEFVSSGAAVLDETLGGGWPLTRIANIVGDESTGKTLLAIEACANFNRRYPKGEMFYREAEDAFDEPYAAALSMPVDKVQFSEPGTFETIEDFYEDLCEATDRIRRKDSEGIYVVDSLDALTSVAEQKRKFGEGSYEMEKAKEMGKLLRLCKGKIAQARMALIIVSQTRDKINAMAFGKKKTRSGGRALNFYASQCLWLSHLDTVTKQRGGIKRATGIRIKAKCEKNKISLPYRTCEFTITFGHGIDALSSGAEWLDEAKRLSEVTNLKLTAYKDSLEKMSDDEYWDEHDRVEKIVRQVWREADQRFLDDVRPKRRME